MSHDDDHSPFPQRYPGRAVLGGRRVVVGIPEISGHGDRAAIYRRYR